MENASFSHFCPPTAAIVAHHSKIFSATKRVAVYSPCLHAKKRASYPWLLILNPPCHDSASDESALALHISTLQCQGVVPPFLTVWVDSPEIPCNPLHASYLVQELAPWLMEKFSATDNARDIIIAGSSLEATEALYLAMKLPRLFRTTIAVDPDLLWSPPSDTSEGWLLRRFSCLPTSTLNIILCLSTTQEATQELCSLFIAKNYLFSCHHISFCEKKYCRRNFFLMALKMHVSHFFTSSFSC